MASGSSLQVGKERWWGTTEVQLSNEFVVGGRKVVLIDTPAVGDEILGAPDVLEIISAFLETMWVVFVHFIVLSTQHLDRSRGRSTLGGFIYLHEVSNPWVTGMYARHLMMFRKLCGKSTLENVIIVTTMWDRVSYDGEARENTLVTDFFKRALDKGAQLVRYRVAAQPTAHDIIRRVTQNLRISPEPNEQIRRHQDELKAVREEMIKVLRDQEQILRREFEQEACKVWEQIMVEFEQKIYKVQEQARVELEENRLKQMRVELEQEIHKVQERARVESEREIRKVREHTRNCGGELFPP